MKLSNCRGFTLVELLVSTALIVVLTVILVSITNQTNNVWRYTSGKMEQFRESRNAFDTVTTRLSQATLNTYWDYNDRKAPTSYERRSELRFISGNKSLSGGKEELLGDYGGARRVSHSVFFHAPLGFVEHADGRKSKYNGLSNLLNVWGYYVELQDDKELRPNFLQQVQPAIPLRTRFRLMEFMQPAEQLRTYHHTSGTALTPNASKDYVELDWFKKRVNEANAPVHVLSENIIALIILPELTKQDRENIAKTGGAMELAPNYNYDSTADGDSAAGSGDRSNVNTRNQLPPVVQVTLVAIDEQSAGRISPSGHAELAELVKGKFKKASDYSADLSLNNELPNGATLENKLVSMKVNYRVFTTNVPIRSAKWSRAQAPKP